MMLQVGRQQKDGKVAGMVRILSWAINPQCWTAHLAL